MLLGYLPLKQLNLDHLLMLIPGLHCLNGVYLIPTAGKHSLVPEWILTEVGHSQMLRWIPTGVEHSLVLMWTLTGVERSLVC
jgi:hypothetical protein